MEAAVPSIAYWVGMFPANILQYHLMRLPVGLDGLHGENFKTLAGNAFRRCQRIHRVTRIPQKSRESRLHFHFFLLSPASSWPTS